MTRKASDVIWENLKYSCVRGDPDSPLIIALHGFGQYAVRPWWGGWWRYLDFARMTGLLDECRERNWSCWMPQAPWRNWRSTDAVYAESMILAAQDATGSDSRPHLMGFSDGATLVNRFLFGGLSLPGFVSYEGIRPPIDCRPTSRALICHNLASSNRQIRESIIQNATDTHEMLIDADCDVRLMVGSSDRHEWTWRMTTRILDWVEQ